MRRINLQYNSLFNEYFLDFGPHHKDKLQLGILSDDELLLKLKKQINIKRNTQLYLDKGITEKLRENIKEIFKGTKIIAVIGGWKMINL